MFFTPPPLLRSTRLEKGYDLPVYVCEPLDEDQVARVV
jgi:hypothetical protein